MGILPQTEKTNPADNQRGLLAFGTQGGNRTRTILLSLDFESSASTNSATWAKNSGAKVDIFRISANLVFVFLKLFWHCGVYLSYS